MWKVFLVFFLLFFFSRGETEERCSPLCQPPRGSLSCHLDTHTVSCNSTPVSGFVARYKCDNHYKLKGEKNLKCLANGRWSSSVPKCVPNCGTRNSEVALIVSGKVVKPEAFPWHVALYYFNKEKYEFWCGGSLISEYAILTAAHCMWDFDPEKFIIAVGKFNRELNVKEKNIQKLKIIKVKMLKTYQDIDGNYNGDISVVFLNKKVKLNNFVRPICLDLDQELVDIQLSQNSMGMVVGWGLTENETFSEFLRGVSMPVISDEQCIDQQKEGFRKFVTYTSFCAGYNNGTGVCNGDSGGGLVFFDNKTSQWYLQGIVSVSPRRSGTAYCDPNFYTVFTKVGSYTNWLKKIIKEEEILLESNEDDDENCFETKTNEVNSIKENDKINKNIYRFIWKYFNMSDYGKFDFPHSKKIMSLLSKGNNNI